MPLSGDPPPHLITTASRVSCTGIYGSYFTCDSCRRIVRPCSHASAPGMILPATRSDLCSSPISLHLTSHTLPVTSPFFISKNKMIGLHVVTFRNWFVHLFQPWSYGLSVLAFPSQQECSLDTSLVAYLMQSHWKSRCTAVVIIVGPFLQISLGEETAPSTNSPGRFHIKILQLSVSSKT